MQNVRVRFAYKRGFRRAWIVLSVAWLSILGLLAFASDHDPRYVIELYLVEGVLPVVATYLAGAGLVWIIEGFARPD